MCLSLWPFPLRPFAARRGRADRYSYVAFTLAAPPLLAAALFAAAARPDRVAAIVSRGGRPDLAIIALPQVRAPTLLIVGGADREVLEVNKAALGHFIGADNKLWVVPGATHLFPEPGALNAVVDWACVWFQRHMPKSLKQKRAG